MHEEVRAIIAGRPRGEEPTRSDVERWLGVRLRLARDTGYWRYYEARIDRPPFQRADVRLERDGPRALVVLDAGSDPAVYERELELAVLGPREGLDIVPEVPSEGIISHVYRLGAQTVAFTLTSRSRRLAGLSIAWGE